MKTRLRKNNIVSKPSLPNLFNLSMTYFSTNKCTMFLVWKKAQGFITVKQKDNYATAVERKTENHLKGLCFSCVIINYEPDTK